MPARADRVLYDRGGLRIGMFRRAPWERPFEDTGPTQGHLLVFPRAPVVIQHAGRAPVVADPGRVMLYNRGQAYRREALTPRGDACEWFAFPAGAILEASPAPGPDADRPLTAAFAPVDAPTYLLQRQLVEHLLTSRAAADALLVEESAATLLDRALSRLAPARPDAPTTRSHRELAEACLRLLGSRLAEPLTLRDLAASLGSSPFHLARLFRRHTGTSLHAHRTTLRLRASLERVLAGGDLAHIAADLGFSSHSHFTSSFRRAFGHPPSAIRARS